MPASQVSTVLAFRIDRHAVSWRVESLLSLGSAYEVGHRLADILAGQLLHPSLQTRRRCSRWRCSRCPTSCRVQAPRCSVVHAVPKWSVHSRPLRVVCLEEVARFPRTRTRPSPPRPRTTEVLPEAVETTRSMTSASFVDTHSLSHHNVRKSLASAIGPVRKQTSWPEMMCMPPKHVVKRPKKRSVGSQT